jgi:hypothetical protein
VRHLFNDIGFKDVCIDKKENSEDIIKGWNVGTGTEKFVFSAYVTAIKPTS